MRTFKLVRDRDISGVSGTGVVAEGVEFHDGQCILSWFGQFHTIEVSPDIESIVKIHGHEGATRVEFEDDSNLAKLEAQLKEFRAILFGKDNV